MDTRQTQAESTVTRLYSSVLNELWLIYGDMMLVEDVDVEVMSKLRATITELENQLNTRRSIH